MAPTNSVRSADVLLPSAVLSVIRLGGSNGRLEGINSELSALKRGAYAFDSAAALIAKLFLC